MAREFTKRDHALLSALGDYGVLSTRQVWTHFFPGIRKTTMLRRLRLLERRELIQRIPGLRDGSFGWRLTVESARALGIVGIPMAFNRFSVEHDVTLCEVRFSLKSVGIGKNWTPEHVLRARAWAERLPYQKEPEFVPDGVFLHERDGEFLPVAVELELTMKNEARYLKSLKTYYWKQGFGMYWYLVPTISFGEKLERLWKKATNTTSPKFAWSLISQVIDSPYDIELHANGKTSLLRDTVKLTNPSAHSTAQPVSSFVDENPQDQNPTNLLKS